MVNSDGMTLVPRGALAGDTLDELRSRLSGWHFAKEALDPQALEVLYVAEALIAILDEEASNGYRR